jgi:hypothetical protein
MVVSSSVRSQLSSCFPCSSFNLGHLPIICVYFCSCVASCSFTLDIVMVALKLSVSNTFQIAPKVEDEEHIFANETSEHSEISCTRQLTHMQHNYERTVSGTVVRSTDRANLNAV